MRMLGVVLVSLLAMVSIASAQMPAPPARTCQEDRDHLRVLVRMLADNRGNAEWGLAEALARQGRLEEELKMLRELVSKLQPKPPPKPEDKK